MRVGIISNCDLFIPIAYTLANNGLQVCISFLPPEDGLVTQKVRAFIQATKISCDEGNVYEWLENTMPDVVFVYGYKHLLDVTRFSQPVYNIHPGPLPAFRGPVPVFWQLKQGLALLGMSIHVLSDRFDAGMVVWNKYIPDQPHYNYALVQQIFSQVAVQGVFFILNALAGKVPLTAVESAATMAYHKRPELADVLIDWEHMSADVICNLIRACNPWNKGAVTGWNGLEVKLMDACITGVSTTLAPGMISEANGSLLIATQDKQLLQVNMLLLHDAFVPAYQVTKYGIEKGKKIGTP